MFGRRIVTESRIVKDRKPAEDSTQIAPRVDPSNVIITAAVVGKDVMVLGGALYAGKRVLDTAAQIAIIAAKAKLK